MEVIYITPTFRLTAIIAANRHLSALGEHLGQQGVYCNELDRSTSNWISALRTFNLSSACFAIKRQVFRQGFLRSNEYRDRYIVNRNIDIAYIRPQIETRMALAD